MQSKFYAVRKGKQTGIFRTWELCKAQVHGFPGAEYKSFSKEEDALEYLNVSAGFMQSRGKNTMPSEGIKDVEIYVDGSYNSNTKEFSYGMVVLRDGEEEKFSRKFADEELAKMRNVAGEIKGAQAAMQYAIDHALTAITIYHDYEGIAKWCLGEWKTNKEGTKSYKAFYDCISEKVSVRFVKVTGHSNDKYNDMADELAKQAIGILENPE